MKLIFWTKKTTTLLCMVALGVGAAAGSVSAADSESRLDPTFESSVTIKDTVNATLVNNPTIKSFQEYRQAHEFDRKRAVSGFLPKVDGRVGWGYEQWDDATTRSSGYSQDPHTFYQRFDGALTLSQTIWDGLASWSRYRLADAMEVSAQHRLFDNAEALSLDAILAHIEVCRQRMLVALSENNVGNHERILQSQIERHQAGASTMADVTQVQTRLARAEASLVETKQALKVALSNYQRLTGGIPVEFEAPDAPGYIYPSLDNALANSMTNNSKVLSKRADIDAGYAQKDLDKSAFHPRIYLEAGPEYRWQVESSNTYAWGTAVMLRAQWNLYNGHYDWFNMKADKARIRQYNRELQELRNSLAEETTNTWTQWMSTRDQIKFYTNAVVYNTQTRDMYLEQFNVGQRSLLDVLDSENELYSSSMQLTTAQMNDIAAQYRLLTLGGKLLSYFEIDKTGLAIQTDENDFSDEDLNQGVINNDTYLYPFQSTRQSTEFNRP